MNLLVKNYKSLYDLGRHDEAERYLSEYMHGQSLSGKVQLIANIVRCDAEGIFPDSISNDVNRLKTPLIDHRGMERQVFDECHQIVLSEKTFTVGITFVFHRGNRGDANIISIWRDEENIYTIGALVEAARLQMFYDKYDDILYICYETDKEETVDGQCISERFLSVITIEDPLGMAICNNFRWLRI